MSLSIRPDESMLTALHTVAKAYWWLVLLRGILAMLLGGIALLWPGITLTALIYVFGAYALMEGVSTLAFGGRTRNTGQSRGWAIVSGIASLLVGLVAFFLPGITSIALLSIVASWSIVVGALEVGHAFDFKHAGSNQWGWMLASGCAWIALAVLLVTFPGTGLLRLLGLIGLSSIVVGVMLIVAAVAVRAAKA